MGIGCRVFLIGDDDSLQRISMVQLTRLLRFDRRESLQQYAGKRVRCAMVFLEVTGRLVELKIIKKQCLKFVLKLNKKD